MVDFRTIVESKRKTHHENKTKRFGLRIPANEHSQYSKLADDIGVSLNELILTALEAAYTNYTGKNPRE